jgi:hypothetical protein
VRLLAISGSRRAGIVAPPELAGPVRAALAPSRDRGERLDVAEGSAGDVVGAPR